MLIAMKKTTYLKTTLVVLILLFSASIFSQNHIPFTPRFDQDVKGDIVLIGNNISTYRIVMLRLCLTETANYS